MEEHVVVKCVGLTLHVALDARRRKERVAILVQVADFAREMLVEVLAHYPARGKAIADASTYRVAMPATLARGALGYFTVWQKSDISQQTGVTVDTAVRDYLSGKRTWPLGESNRIVGE